MTTVAVYRQIRRCWDLDAGELVERKEVVSFFPLADETYRQEGKRYTYDGIPRWPFRGPGGRQVFCDDMRNHCHARGRIVETPTTYGVERKGGTTPIIISLPDDANVFDPVIAPGGKPWRDRPAAKAVVMIEPPGPE